MPRSKSAASMNQSSNISNGFSRSVSVDDDLPPDLPPPRPEHPPANADVPVAYVVSCIIALYGKAIAKLRSVTCHMGSRGSQSVTCYPTQVNAPCLNPSQTGRYSIYLHRKDARLSWLGVGNIYRNCLSVRRQSLIQVTHHICLIALDRESNPRLVKLVYLVLIIMESKHRLKSDKVIAVPYVTNIQSVWQCVLSQENTWELAPVAPLCREFNH